MSDKKILIAEAGRNIRDAARALLTGEGFAVEEAASSEEMQLYLRDHAGEVCLVILDVMMEGVSGYEMCLRLREEWKIPVLFLTEQAKEEVLAGSSQEFLARVRGLQDRYRTERGEPEVRRDEAEWYGLRVRLDENMVWRGDQEVTLTDTEWHILCLLMRNRGKIFSMEEIYEAVWKEIYLPASSNTVMVHIRRLREKIEPDPRHPEYIKTVWRKGYRLGK